jgi:hypothetical protein
LRLPAEQLANLEVNSLEIAPDHFQIREVVFAVDWG